MTIGPPFGRNSYDNSCYKSYVHFDVDYDNAYWNGSVMTYGDGSGTYFDVLTSIDVAAHELDMLFVKTTSGMGRNGHLGACIEYNTQHLENLLG
jgi:Zn-dependent metalloprotease